MQNNQIKPDKITKPIQLLAAWLVGLILVNGSFLAAAQFVSTPSWGPALLLIASVVNVPVFIGALFILQTKFRPEMQEDFFYSDHLKRKEDSKLNVLRKEREKKEEQTIKDLVDATNIKDVEEREDAIKTIISNKTVENLVNYYLHNPTLESLFNDGSIWLEDFFHNKATNITKMQIRQDIVALALDNLIEGNINDIKTIKLTELGSRVCAEIEKLKS